MNRRRAIIRMGWIMIAGSYMPLISWVVVANVFPDIVLVSVLLLGYLVWMWLFGGYIKRMNERINRDYPKEEENSNKDNNEV
jgi:Flp pilus assembly protein TadB